MRNVIQKCLNTFKKRYTVGGARFDQLRLEALEGRMLLSGTMYVVDSLDDVVAEDGMLTLREAIEAANLVGGCPMEVRRRVSARAVSLRVRRFILRVMMERMRGKGYGLTTLVIY